MALLLALILILRLAGVGRPWLLGGILDRHSSKKPIFIFKIF
jgi:hypothetical protein